MKVSLVIGQYFMKATDREMGEQGLRETGSFLNSRWSTEQSGVDVAPVIV